jgi:hypothetical protein
MRTQHMVYRRTWYSRRRRGLYPWTVIVVPWGRYERHAYLFWRIRIPLWLGGAGAGWAVAGPAGVVGGLAAAYLAEGVFSYRAVPPPGQVPKAVSPTNEEIAAARAQNRRWDTEAVPSPGGWRTPATGLAGWSWAPPGGLRPRLDRVPAWVGLWYRTPFVDRYAYAWMWEHGGWDVLPPHPGA